MITAPTTCGSVATLLDENVQSKRKGNREFLSHVIRTVQFLAAQGLAFRGNWNPDTATEDGNFIELLKFSCHGKSGPDIDAFLSQKYNKYVSPLIQNEIVK